MFKIYDGREDFYQWDLDRKLIVEDASITQVHFCNRMAQCSVIRYVYELNGLHLVDVPNLLLQNAFTMNVYGYDKNHTRHDERFKVIARSRPENYVYSEEELKTWELLNQRITDIEENGIPEEVIEAKVNAYLEENPIEAGATAEEAAQIEANKTAIEDLEAGMADYVTNAKLQKEYITKYAIQSSYYTKTEVDNKLAAIEIPEIPDVSSFALKTEIPTQISDLANDINFITENSVQNYLESYYTKTEVNSLIPDVSGYQTATQVNTLIDTKLAAIGVAEEGAY